MKFEDFSFCFQVKESSLRNSTERLFSDCGRVTDISAQEFNPPLQLFEVSMISGTFLPLQTFQDFNDDDDDLNIKEQPDTGDDASEEDEEVNHHKYGVGQKETRILKTKIIDQR